MKPAIKRKQNSHCYYIYTQAEPLASIARGHRPGGAKPLSCGGAGVQGSTGRRLTCRRRGPPQVRTLSSNGYGRGPFQH